MPGILRIFLAVILSALVATCIAGLALWKTQSLRLYSVQSGSMAPALKTGDLAVSVKPKVITAGDIVSYQSGSDPRKIISHRVINTLPQKGYVITQGDSLPLSDPPVPYSSILGKTVFAVPAAGRLFDLIHKPLGLISLVYLPSLVLAAYELNRLIRRFSYDRYTLTHQR
jgi:signal peptidase